jgi:small-conductance mechanosensitive channel
MAPVLFAATPLLAQAEEVVSEKVEVCGPEGRQSFLCDVVYDLTEGRRAAEIADALDKPVRIAFILLVAFVVNRLLRRVIRRLARRIADRDRAHPERLGVRRRGPLAVLADTEAVPTIRRAQRIETIGVVLRSVATLVVWVTAGFFILDTFAINLGPLLAGAGFLGVAFGFGAQRLIQDFTSGLFMIVEDQFGVGDVINVGDIGGTIATGTVEGISLRTTRIRDVEGVLWYVPNGEMRRVANLSQKWARAVLDIDVAYDTDIAKAQRVILETATAMYEEPRWHDKEILEPPEVWGVEAFGPDAISIRLVVKTAPLDQWVVARELRRRLKEAFDREGIRVPYPQRTLWLRADLAPEAPSLDDGGRGPDA